MRFILSFILSLITSAANATLYPPIFAAIGGPETAFVPHQTFSNNYTSSCLNSYFSRASNGWGYVSGGSVSLFSSNVSMCQTYDPTGAVNEGIRFDNTRQNLIAAPLAPTTGLISTASNSYYVGWMTGTGSIALTGDVTCTITAVSPCYVNLSPGQNFTYTASGTVTFGQIERTGGISTTYQAPSSPILTGSYTRQADSQIIPLSDMGLNAGISGTITTKYTIPAYNSTNQYNFQISDGTNNNYFACFTSAGTQRPTCTQVVSGSIVASISIAPIAINTNHILAFSYSSTRMCLSIDSSVATCTSLSYPGISLTSFRVGNSNVLNQALMGNIYYITAWNGAVSDAILQALSTATSPFPTALHGIGMMGQSNGYGSYASPSLTTAAPFPTQLYMPNDYWQVNGCGSTNCSILGAPFSGVLAAFTSTGPVPPCNGLTTADGNCGEVSLVSAGAQSISQGATANLMVRGYAAPGKTISEIQKGNQAYTNYTTSSLQIYSLAMLNASSYVIDLMAFNHQQTDAIAGTDPATYCAGVQTLQANAATDIGLITGQSGLPFGIVQYASEADGMGAYTAQCLLNLIIAYPTKFYPVGPSYFLPHNSTHGPHFSNYGQRTQGSYIGKCHKAGSGCTALYVTSASLAGSTITLTVNNPVPPMVLDATASPQGLANNYGIHYVDDTMSAYVTGVSIVDATHLSVSLNTVPTGSNKYILGGFTGEPGVNPLQETQASRTPLAISNSGIGGTPGTCTVTLNLDPTNTREQAQYSVHINGAGSISGWSTATPVIKFGRYSAALLSTNQNNVPVTGCGLSGATVSGVNLVMQPDGMVNDVSLPTITGWDGIPSGTCILEANHANFRQQPAYNVSVTAGVPTITGVATYGNYPIALLTSPSYAVTLTNVPVKSGGTCSATSALLQTVRVTQGVISNNWAGTWMNIRDSDTTANWSGGTLPNLMMNFIKGPL